MPDNDPAPDLIPAWYDLLTEARRQRDETATQARAEIAALRDQLRAAREEAGRLRSNLEYALGVELVVSDALRARLAAAEGLLRQLLASAELHCHGTGEAEDAARAHLEDSADAP